MTNATSPYGKQEPKQSESGRITAGDSEPNIERYFGILRILLLAKRSNPYAEQQDIRGILLDSYC